MSAILFFILNLLFVSVSFLYDCFNFHNSRSNSSFDFDHAVISNSLFDVSKNISVIFVNSLVEIVEISSSNKYFFK
jgi:hypothetical protein